MIRLLHLDTSARPGRSGAHAHGSHTRRLTHQFVTRWQAARPDDEVIYRDIGSTPPSFINGEWIQAAFTAPDERQSWMADVLAESDELIDELIPADILVIGAPLYNFGMPASLKAWVDQVVRIGRTVDFDPSDHEDPFIPRLNDRPRHAVVLSSRGGVGFDPGGELAHMNHLEPSLATALGFIGITSLHSIAIENQEAGGDLLAASIADAERRVSLLVERLLCDVATPAKRALPA